MANRIHPTAVIGEGVELGDGNIVGPYAVIVGPTTIGDENWIGPHVTIGTPGEDRGREHPAAWDAAPKGDPDHDGHGVVIGSRNRLREYVSVHQGTWRTTTIGDDSYYLRSSHVAHDCLMEDGLTMATNAVTGGHCHVWTGANLGLGAILHQRAVVGPGAMVGMGAAVRHEVGAFQVSVGVPARPTRVNAVWLSRRGLDDATIEGLRPWILGDGPLPGDGLLDRLPGDLSTLVKAWDARPRPEHQS
ncbi:UDP-N-acetylglucosamine acyltransferase [Amycolatopsis sp. H20-H5]|uniref:UDP-N-acetylglucosamine acyltransferase n=1 Tax=Amycolatopsis sp. H20-H5 TaxID=3046309 RepID=UPI002DBB435B|nr:UDP-N-acetylglucosamine acyltransferase [Amycolatopsis sp. H20-H5]MEC3980538.1 UDP-N-acetylglucosamine acyltransferase [Amycolatopsis sp. H20-H5]